MRQVEFIIEIIFAFDLFLNFFKKKTHAYTLKAIAIDYLS